MESADVRDLFNKPNHPYTQALMDSVPQMERTERLFSIEGQPPALYALPPGCRFADRCAHAKEKCQAEYPVSFPVEEGHTADCWMLDPDWKELAPVEET